MAQRLHPVARDAAVRRIAMITTGVVVASLAGTVGLGAAIAAATPAPSKSNKTDYGEADKNQPAAPAPPVLPGQPVPPPVQPGQQVQPEQPVQPAPPEQLPESSSGDEDTTSGGS